MERYPADKLWDATRYLPGWDGTKDRGDDPRLHPYGHDLWQEDGYPDPSHPDPPAHPHWDAATRTVDLRPLYKRLARRIRCADSQPLCSRTLWSTRDHRLQSCRGPRDLVLAAPPGPVFGAVDHMRVRRVLVYSGDIDAQVG